MANIGSPSQTLMKHPFQVQLSTPFLPGYLGHLNWGHLCIVENLTNVASSTNQLTIDKHLQVIVRWNVL